MTTTYGYIRISPKISDIDRRIEAFSNYGNEIELHTETKIRGGVPLQERPVYSEVDKKLAEGDELIVWWIDELGKEFATCVNNIKMLIDRGVTIKTIVQDMEFKLNDKITDELVKLMQGFAESEKHRRLFAAELGRRSLRKDSENWKTKFSGRKRNEGMHREIAQALFEGKTLQAVADETGASMSTVKRVKARIKGNDEMGHLRGQSRGHGGKGKHGSKRDGKRAHGRYKVEDTNLSSNREA
ncbi:hypothetical protein BA893_19460 [Vibrio natriegens]|uniref:recombinase family protein n=1 Tax=Vibrio natriegens TaxID=691 RepID=UPI000803EF8D|nr:recombinase family protein [Vibrio natriegens]ANQ23812.1 hypothetical protein BA893_19460 [Vibrio natriegens]